MKKNRPSSAEIVVLKNDVSVIPLNETVALASGWLLVVSAIRPMTLNDWPVETSESMRENKPTKSAFFIVLFLDSEGYKRFSLKTFFVEITCASL